MATHLVKAKTIVRAMDEHGILKSYTPGDIFRVRNQELRALLAEGKIEIPCEFTLSSVYSLDDCGIAVTGSLEAVRSIVNNISSEIANDVRWPRTLFWDTAARLRADLIPVGFDRVAHGWQVAAPLASYRLLARDIGDDAGRTLTAKIIHDLRVPFYDVRALFVRDCTTTRDLLKLYAAELQRHPEPRLAFLRAMYQVKPVLCALPASWVGK